MTYIAVVRMQGGSLIAITKDDDKLAEWPTREEAEAAMAQHILEPLGIEIVEIQS